MPSWWYSCWSPTISSAPLAPAVVRVVRTAETYLYAAVDRLLSDAWQVDAFAMQRFIDTYCRDKLDP